ncbi:MAG: DUF1156 domain-containing protein [Phycisphaerales bacterium]|nr:DUF1156 domain-containing protein [Phycisphaerales bacterium]
MSGNGNGTDKRLIEDYLPIDAISIAASSEPRTKGHISTLHVWRARRPLVACRAAVYSALVTANRWVKDINLKQPPSDADKADAIKNGKAKGLNRAAAGRFITELCKYPGSSRVIQQAADHIRHGRESPPRVLDMFAGGGAIPIEAARLGCETYAIDLNPVAFLIELCTVAFPQQFGPGLADDLEQWARLVLDRTRADVADVTAHIARPNASHQTQVQHRIDGTLDTGHTHTLSVVAYYWTRTVPCPNRQCKGTVPLYRQTWLRKKASGYVALRPVPDLQHRVVRFQVAESTTETGFDFDPSGGSQGSSTTCPFCRASVEGRYVRQYGDESGFGQQLMCVIALNPQGTGKLYLTDESLAHGEEERQALAAERAASIEQELGSSSLDQEIPPTGNAGLATGNSYLYGIRTFRQAFLPRQRLTLLSMAREVRRAHQEMLEAGIEPERARAITTCLGLWVSRLTDRLNALARWDNTGEKVQGLTSLKRFAMAWDFPEVNIFGGGSGDAWGNLEYITATMRREGEWRNPVTVMRGSATDLPFDDATFDAVITDPPYYDNESYSELSDVCYVWLRPVVGFLYPEHFATPLTPKKKECVAAAYRQGGADAAREYYENCMLQSLREAHRVIKPGGVIVVVYAHKTTLGWSTLVDAFRQAGFMVTEAWPLDTETKARVAHRGDAVLATSIFLVGRKREASTIIGEYDQVHPELREIVRERVAALWEEGITGADLVIASVGAGLRAFTKYERVEFANGEEVPAGRFLAEVEGVVLDVMLEQIAGKVARGVTGVDPPSRFYVLWRYVYKAAAIDSGEAIVFTYGQHVELDGQKGLSSGTNPLVEKKKGSYRVRDFAERGKDDKLGLPTDEGEAAPLVDALHRVLWLMEYSPRRLTEFLRESRCNTDQLRVLAQALSGPALKGGEMGQVSAGEELAALTKLTANWRSVIEDALSPLERSQ